jgi:hypothetical protein
MLQAQISLTQPQSDGVHKTKGGVTPNWPFHLESAVPSVGKSHKKVGDQTNLLRRADVGRGEGRVRPELRKGRIMAGEIVRYVVMQCARLFWLGRKSQASSMRQSKSYIARSSAKNTESIGLPVLTALLMTFAAALVLIELGVRCCDLAGLPTADLIATLHPSVFTK